MNSDLLAQMKNKLIKLKQQAELLEPPSMAESQPLPEPQPQTLPQSHMTQVPKNSQFQSPKPVCPLEKPQPAPNQNQLRVIMSDKLLMLQQMRAKKEMQKALPYEKKPQKQVKTQGRCESIQGSQNLQHPEGESSLEPLNIKQGDQSQEHNRRGEAEKPQGQVESLQKDIRFQDKDHIQPNEQNIAVPLVQLREQMVPESQGEALPQKIGQDFQEVENYIVPQPRNQEQVAVDEMDQAQNKIVRQPIIEDGNEGHAELIRGEEKSEIDPQQHQMAQPPAIQDNHAPSPQVQLEESNVHQTQKNNQLYNKDGPINNQPLQQAEQPQPHPQETRMTLMLEKMRLMRTQIIKYKPIQQQPDPAPAPLPVQAEVQPIQKTEEDEVEQQNVPEVQEVQEVVEAAEQEEVHLSKLYRKQRKIYLKEVQNILRMTANIKSKVNSPAPAQNTQPQAVGLTKLTARLRQIVDYLIPR